MPYGFTYRAYGYSASNRVGVQRACLCAENMLKDGLYIWMTARWVMYGVAGGELGDGCYDFA